MKVDITDIKNRVLKLNPAHSYLGNFNEIKQIINSLIDVIEKLEQQLTKDTKE